MESRSGTELLAGHWEGGMEGLGHLYFLVIGEEGEVAAVDVVQLYAEDEVVEEQDVCEDNPHNNHDEKDDSVPPVQRYNGNI